MQTRIESNICTLFLRVPFNSCTAHSFSPFRYVSHKISRESTERKARRDKDFLFRFISPLVEMRYEKGKKNNCIDERDSNWWFSSRLFYAISKMPSFAWFYIRCWMTFSPFSKLPRLSLYFIALDFIRKICKRSERKFRAKWNFCTF